LQASYDSREALAFVIARAVSAEDQDRCVAALVRKTEILWHIAHWNGWIFPLRLKLVATARPCLLMEWEGYKKPTHHVSRLEIPPWASRVHIVAISAHLRLGFIGIECLEDTNLALGCNACIGTIGIHKNLRQRGPLKLCGWPVLFVYRPTADQPESNPVWLFSYEPTRFEDKLSG
jgi:hypothetical protein